MGILSMLFPWLSDARDEDEEWELEEEISMLEEEEDY